MFLISGLGNPGEKYDLTPHNAGFLFLERFRLKLKDDMRFDVDFWNSDKIFESELCKINRDGELLAMLQKPSTFMNNSGRAVRKVVEKLNVEEVSKNFVLIHDDLDLPLGSYKIQYAKGPKGHNGVDSVEQYLGTGEFMRVRIGVEDRGQSREIPGDRYVLIPYNPEQQGVLNEAIEKGVEELLSIVQF